MSEIVMQNLLSPAVLFFMLGIAAALVKSDLKIPGALSESLSIYLLIAIGLKGGIELSHYSPESVIKPIIGAVLLGSIIPFIVLLMNRIIKMDVKNAIGLAAAYGSVSIVTYGAAVEFLEKNAISYEGFMNALVVVMESPAIFVSLLLLKIIENKENKPAVSMRSTGIAAWSATIIDKEVVKESLFGKSVFLLLGSLTVGLILGERAMPAVKPLFMDLYSSVLILFLLSMGLTTGQRLPEVKKQGKKLLLFGVMAPVLFGTLGVLTGNLVGLSLGGMTLMGVLAGSASYIAAPAALKASVPEANPSIYLGSALGVTFPFNLVIGIPVYYQIAQWMQ